MLAEMASYPLLLYPSVLDTFTVTFRTQNKTTVHILRFLPDVYWWLTMLITCLTKINLQKTSQGHF